MLKFKLGCYNGPCICRFGLRLEIESNRDKIGLDCFSSLRTINMYPMLFMKKNVITSRKQQLLAHRHP